MSYEVLARKWRPQSFAEVVGQEHVSTTLTNALVQKRVGHAYIFSGIRGVGKTTMARILAKAVNCVQGPTATPCGTCTSCVEIARGNSMDCLEIDGASNRGVEEIRSLRERIAFAPVGGKRKVYIIDEVHMLTSEAFNALLKTLEEPPAHALFILATTNTTRMPDTILSRCQRFHFRRIPTAAIEKHLALMVKKEKLRIEPDAIALVARRGDGSLRDAESLLEQVSTLGGGGAVTAVTVREFLGVMEEDQVFEAGRALAAGEGERVLALLEDVVRAGGDPAEFAEALVLHFRNLMVVTVAPNSPALAELSSEDTRRYVEEAQRLRGVDFLPFLDKLGTALPQYRKSPQPRLEVEIALLTLAAQARGPSASETDRGSSQGALRPAAPRAEAPAPKPTRPVKRSHEGDDAGAGAPMSAMSETAPAAGGAASPAANPRFVDIEAVRGIWSSFVDEVNRKRRALGAYVADGKPDRIEDGRVIVGFTEAKKWSMSQVEARENRLFLGTLLSSLLGCGDLTLGCTRIEGQDAASEPAAPVAETPASASPRDANLQQLLTAFDGRILDIRTTEPGRNLPGGTT